ncbi:MAG: radical SAM protein [bacterium]
MDRRSEKGKGDGKEMEERAEKAWEILGECTLCQRECRVNRFKGEKGYCGAGINPEVSSFNEHHGEEPPISGWKGSGTIFMTHCNLKCVFCQNYPISQMGNGREITIEKMVEMMMILQKRGCHNINFVTPTHYMPQIMKSVLKAREKGLRIPIVYNCGGYESLRAIRVLKGIVEIYMPDIKYSEDEKSKKYSNAEDYFSVAKEAIREMYRQVGDLELDKNGVATRGVLVRHLVMPEDISGTKKVMEFIGEELSRKTYVSIMAQYFPAYRAKEYPEIQRRITRDEYKKALKYAEEKGILRSWIQDGILERT